MRFTSIVSLGVFAFSSLTSAAPTGGEITGVFNPSPLIVSGSIPGGPEFNFTGGLEEVIPLIQELNPQWEGPEPTKTISPNPSSADEFGKRYFQGRPTCWVGASNAALKWAITGIIIPYLNGLPSSVMCGANAYSCARLYCDERSSAWLCNLRGSKLDITCQRAAHAVGEIAKDCVDSFDGQEFTQGLWVDTTSYYVAVQGC